MASDNECPSRARREFLLKGMTLATALPVVLAAAETFSRSAKAQTAGKVNPKDPMAKSLGFSLNANHVNTKKWPKRAGAEGKKQFCWNCMFYTPVPAGTVANKSKAGTCQIFQGKEVPFHGWCNTWSQNPKYASAKHS